MRRLRTGLNSSLVALCTTGFALAVAQDAWERPASGPASGCRSTRRPGRSAPPAGRTRRGQKLNDLLVQWEQQAQSSRRSRSMFTASTRIRQWWDDEEHYIGHAAFKNPQLAYLDFRKVKLQTQARPERQDQEKIGAGHRRRTTARSIRPLSDDCLHRCGGLALSLRRQADFRLPARQGSAATSDRGRAVAVPVQHESGRSETAIQDGLVERKGQGVPGEGLTQVPRRSKDRYSSAWIYLDRDSFCRRGSF